MLDQLKFKVLSISRKATINSVFKTYIVHLNFYIVPHIFFVFPPKSFKNLKCDSIYQFNE